MRIEDTYPMKFERKYVATEWDMGWFCDRCEKLVSWRTAAYTTGGRKYCQDCAREMCNESKGFN